MLVRRLTPQEDKLDLLHIPGNELVPLARLLGALVGRAHTRGATKKPKRGCWSATEVRHVLDSAVRLAGIHEATYLAYCQLSKEIR